MCNTSLVTWLPGSGRRCLSSQRCSCSALTTGSLKRLPNFGRGLRPRMWPPTRSIIPGRPSWGQHAGEFVGPAWVSGFHSHTSSPLPADGCVTAMCPRAAIVSHGMRPLMSLGEVFSVPSSLLPGGSSWRSSGWRRTSWCLRRGPLSSPTFPSKTHSGLSGFCSKFTSSLLSPFFQEGFLDWSLLSLHEPSGIWVSTWQTCPWPRCSLLAFAFACTSLGMAGTWPKC